MSQIKGKSQQNVISLWYNISLFSLTHSRKITGKALKSHNQMLRSRFVVSETP